MESRFDMTDFEHSLKDFADRFEIAPSPRVWNGIYNNLHPGSRWPSMAMGLVFLFSLLGIGHLNNSSKNFSVSDRDAINENASLSLNKLISRTQNIESSSFNVVDENKQERQSAAVVDLFTRKRISGNTNGGNEIEQIANSSVANESSVLKENKILSLNEGSLEKQNTKLQSEENQLTTSVLNEAALRQTNVETVAAITANKNQNSGINKTEVLSTGGINNKEILGSIILISKKELASITVENFVDANNLMTDLFVPISNQIDATPLANSFMLPSEEADLNSNVVVKKATKLKRLKNGKTTWVYFVTPKVSSVYFTGKAIPSNQGHAISPIVIVPNQVGNNMVYNARLGFEAGTEMQYKFANKWQLLTGLQLSYSGYNILTHKVHPTYASLMLKNDAGEAYSKGYFTYYGNGENDNQVLLPNYSLQASIPVGLQYEVWGNENVHIRLSSTIQPSLVLKGHGYLLSSDGKNYVEDNDLMRVANLGANFASIVSFKSKKITWHIGPSVRYQALSSYKNNYPVKEHLIDYGLRIGISQ